MDLSYVFGIYLIAFIFIFISIIHLNPITNNPINKNQDETSAYHFLMNNYELIGIFLSLFLGFFCFNIRKNEISENNRSSLLYCVLSLIIYASSILSEINDFSIGVLVSNTILCFLSFYTFHTYYSFDLIFFLIPILTTCILKIMAFIL